MADLRVKLGSLELQNPVIISSGHLTRTGKDIKKCDGYGTGAIILKSAFLEKEYEMVVKPYAPGLFPDARAEFHSTGDGYLTICGLSPIPVEAWAQWFKENIRSIKTPVIASIMAITVEGYAKAAKMLQEAGAQAIEILLACPLPFLLPYPCVGGASFNPQMVRDVCSEVRKTVDIPIGVKLMFNFLDPSPMKIPREAGLDWVTSCIAIPAAPGIRLDQVEPSIPASVFLSGSKAAKHLNFVSLLNLKEQCKDIHISASGGVQGWSDVIEYVMYGAGSVQIQTLFLQKGLGIIEGMKREISAYMDSKRFASIEEMKGVIFPKLITFDEAISTYAQTRGKVVASVNLEKCTGCGSCEDLCNWDALKVTDERLDILTENCEGCGVCVCACPEEALRLDNVELIRKLARA